MSTTTINMTKGRAKSSNMRAPIVTLGRLVARKFTPCERQRPCSPRWKYCHFTRYWIRILHSTSWRWLSAARRHGPFAIQQINGQNRCHVRGSDVCALYVLLTVQFRQRDDSANDYQISQTLALRRTYSCWMRGATGGHPFQTLPPRQPRSMSTPRPATAQTPGTSVVCGPSV